MSRSRSLSFSSSPSHALTDSSPSSSRSVSPGPKTPPDELATSPHHSRRRSSSQPPEPKFRSELFPSAAEGAGLGLQSVELGPLAPAKAAQEEPPLQRTEKEEEEEMPHQSPLFFFPSHPGRAFQSEISPCVSFLPAFTHVPMHIGYIPATSFSSPPPSSSSRPPSAGQSQGKTHPRAFTTEMLHAQFQSPPMPDDGDAFQTLPSPGGSFSPPTLASSPRPPISPSPLSPEALSFYPPPHPTSSHSLYPYCPFSAPSTPAPFIYPIRSAPPPAPSPPSPPPPPPPPPPSALLALSLPFSSLPPVLSPPPGSFCLKRPKQRKFTPGQAKRDMDKLRDGGWIRSTGIVKFFDAVKAFGFLIDRHHEYLQTDVFVHYTGINLDEGFRCLIENEDVEYMLYKIDASTPNNKFATLPSRPRYQALSVCGLNDRPLLGFSALPLDVQQKLNSNPNSTGPKGGRKQRFPPPPQSGFFPLPSPSLLPPTMGWAVPLPPPPYPLPAQMQFEMQMAAEEGPSYYPVRERRQSVKVL
ncbi:hypothetical protein JCM6882_008661 [Rhodosporidiobolus microsporus]